MAIESRRVRIERQVQNAEDALASIVTLGGLAVDRIDGIVDQFHELADEAKAKVGDH